METRRRLHVPRFLFFDKYFLYGSDVHGMIVLFRIPFRIVSSIGEAFWLQGLGIELAAEEDGIGVLKAGNILLITELQTGFRDFVLVPAGYGAEIV